MTSPYVYKEPIQGSEGFFNRASERSRIASRIAAARPQSVSVVGGLRVGKSSLVNWLCDPGSQAGYLEDPSSYLLLRLRLRYDPPATPSAFFSRVDAAMQYNGRSMVADYDGFSDAVKMLQEEGLKLILFLDDFGEVTQQSGFPLDFFSFMRSVANSNDVGYMTTSDQPLQSLCHTQDIEESPFFNIFTTVTLEPFSVEEARQLVEDPAREAGAPFGEEAEWILELGGTNPYLLQLTSGAACELRARGELDSDALGEHAYQEAKEHLAQYWQSLSDPERELLRAVCAEKQVERRYEYVAEQLERVGTVHREADSYVLNAGLMARYVREASKGGFFRRLFG